MTPPLFIDTWGWVTLRIRNQARHEEVVGFVRDRLQRGTQLITTDYVIDETVTLMYRRAPASLAAESVEQIIEFEERGLVTRERITEPRFQATLDLRRRYADKPDISFTDLSSMVVMEERGIRDVLSGDAHFEHVGLGFRRRPEPET